MYGGANWALSLERASANMKMGKNLGQNTRGHRYITVSDTICDGQLFLRLPSSLTGLWTDSVSIQS
jgi:hypothetical protein